MASADFIPDAPRRRLAALLLAGLAAATTIWSLVPATCQAQGGHPGGAPAASVANAHPNWNELNAVQQRVLAPLAGEWNNFPELNRRKWLQIAERYEKFSPAEQARLQTRMTEWVKMTPQQRRLARENYQITRSLPAQKKAEAWNKYQQLPEEQKKTWRRRRKCRAAPARSAPCPPASACQPRPPGSCTWKKRLLPAPHRPPRAPARPLPAHRRRSPKLPCQAPVPARRCRPWTRRARQPPRPRPAAPALPPRPTSRCAAEPLRGCAAGSPPRPPTQATRPTRALA